ncbi:MAG: hypothetical protein MUE30_12170 [Spirosomaceae bacterium]|jgi:hypothetical protein|nr:hypothetical protein [Spirosomataceae bacterium]
MKTARWLCVLLLVKACAWAQSSASVGVNVSLPTVALLDLAPSSAGISLPLHAPSEAGNSLTVSSDNSKWLNFSSTIESGGGRYITAQIGAGSVPAGLGLRLALAPYAGGGAGALGGGGASILLSAAPQTIVSSIGGAYTGDGTGNGYHLQYALEIQNFAQLKHDLSSALTITFTFVDL